METAIATSANMLGFTVNYDPSVPDKIRQAVDYAVGLLDRALDTTAETLDVSVKWVPLGAGVVGTGIGGDGTSSDTKDFPNAPVEQPTPFYRFALANQFAGTDLNGDAADITIQLNNNLDVPLYVGTDANPAADQVDLVTTVIHEIIHAVGFGDLLAFNPATGEGSWQSGATTAGIFETLVENGAGDRIIDTAIFPNPSVALGNAMTSNDLFFTGALATAANDGTPPKLYAPNPYEQGSSILHLDEATFADGSNSLMTPRRATGVAIHDPGPLTWAILQDLGWKLKADLKVSVTTDNPTPKQGEAIAYTVKLTNIGPGEATDIQLETAFPADRLAFTENTVSDGSYNPNTGSWEVGNLANGASATLTLEATVTAAINETITVSAEVTSVDQKDPDSENNFSQLEIAVANSAPTLDPGGTPTIAAINEDDINNPGTPVSALIASSAGISDRDSSAIAGIAVTGADNTNGTWQFSIDKGSTWKDFGAASDREAILLASDAIIRFIPNPNFNGNAGNIAFRAWDGTFGENGDINVDTSSNGGITAFSADEETASLAVSAVNDAPTFTKGSDVTVSEESGTVAIPGWATGIFSGADDEAGQRLNFTVSSNNNALFAVAPTIDAATGNLTFTPAPNAFGAVPVSVQLKDDGGTENGGKDTSNTDTFNIFISPINDDPTVSDITKTELENSTISLNRADFAIAFGDFDSDILRKILITSLPNNGTLTLNSNPVTLNQEIVFADLENLTFTPGANFNGNDSFGWNGFDGITYAIGGAKVNLEMPNASRANRMFLPDCPMGFDDRALTSPNAIERVKEGTEGDDLLIGSNASEAFEGKGGFDIAIALAGNDNLNGGTGNDSLFGNEGDDFLDGGEGDELLRGGKDNDTLLGGNGNDIIAGDMGNDTLSAGMGNDLLFGNIGSDRIEAADGEDTVYGGKENDTIGGDIGNDILAGDMGDDFLCAGAENDWLYGNLGADSLDGDEGDDMLYGGKDSDILYGGNGNDILSGDVGSDTLIGGTGSDRFALISGKETDRIIDFELGIDFLELTGGLTFEQLSITAESDATNIAIAATGEILASLIGVRSEAIGIDDFTLA